MFQIFGMKKETGIIIAAGIGFLAVIGMIGLRKFLNRKSDDYDEYYSDFHRHFERRYRHDDHHGVEYLGMN